MHQSSGVGAGHCLQTRDQLPRDRVLGFDPTAESTSPIDGGPGKYGLAETGREPHPVAGRCHLAWICPELSRLCGEEGPLQ
jgi:hypothetical protein